MGTGTQSLSALAAEVLLVCAEHARRDGRGVRAAVQSLWCRFHAESYLRGDVELLGVVFRALGAAANVSDVIGYLGNVLRAMDADERAALCERASRVVT